MNPDFNSEARSVVTSESKLTGRSDHARVQIRDVARHAGVSIGTVSNVLNGRDSVAPELVEKVRNSVDSLGFVPNDNARNLKSSDNQTLGLLVLSTYNSFFNAFADEAEVEADRHGRDLILAASAQLPERERKYLEMFERQRVGGVLLAAVDGVTPAIAALHSRGTPVILLGATNEDEFCSVSVDADEGGYLAARHLIEQGRRRLLCIGGPTRQVQDRLDGANRAVAEVEGVTLDYLTTSDLTVREGQAAADQILAMAASERPDGIFALNDLVAIGVVNQLSRMGRVAIPDDISVVGHDDIDFAAMAVVPLTTVRQPIEALASTAVRLALDEANEGVGHAHRHLQFTPELIVRESSTAPIR